MPEGCTRRQDGPGDQPVVCGRTPILYRLRAGHGGDVLALLCGPCAEAERRRIAGLKSQGVKMHTELVLEEIENVSEEAL